MKTAVVWVLQTCCKAFLKKDKGKPDPDKACNTVDLIFQERVFAREPASALKSDQGDSFKPSF